MSKTPENFDCLLVGGGPVGFIFAATLLKEAPHLRIALVERLPLETLVKKEQPDHRTTTLSAHTCDVLSSLDVWHELFPESVPIKKIFVTDQNGEASKLVFDHTNSGKIFGYTINNTLLRSTLTKNLQKLKNLTIFDSSQIKNIEKSAAFITVTTQNKCLQSPLVVGADGRSSQVRSLLNFSIKKKAYNQSALVGLLQHTNPHKNTASEVFYPNGPVAFLPYGPHDKERISAFVLCDKPKSIEALKHANKKLVLDFLKTRAPSYLGDILKIYNQQSFILEIGKVILSYQERSVLIGDAAQYIHPVAGQGLNLGVRDAVTLAKHLGEMQKLGVDLGSTTTLEVYQKQRRLDVWPMISLTHGLINLFGIDNYVASFGRRSGFSLINKSSFLKDFFVRKAMGY